MSTIKRKLIEVSLPLEAINRESARDSSTLLGHPWNIHYWWARRKLPACRAVLFAQLVDDPTARPEEFPTEVAQEAERRRLFEIIERLVVWENINDEVLLREAHEEILKSTGGSPPAILDPFAGGGSIPLEAQRLGLEAHASDLNPVAVLINKALVEVPPKFAGQPPVFPGAADQQITWPRATGLAEDVRRYGLWMRDEAERRIGHLYPKATLDDGTEVNVIAWIWARTVTCPNPACGIQMPLVRSWWLSKKKGKEAYVVPTILEGHVEFSISHDPQGAPSKDDDGTMSRTGARCVACGTAVSKSHVQSQSKAGLMGATLMAIVGGGDRRRHYLDPTQEHLDAAVLARPTDVLDGEMPDNARWFSPPVFGIRAFADVFTARQLTALTTFSDLVTEVRNKVLVDAAAVGRANDGVGLEANGTGSSAYADAVCTYLALCVDRASDNWSSLASWHSGNGQLRNVFARQAVPMVWDFAEANPFSDESVGWSPLMSRIPPAIGRLGAGTVGEVRQVSATDQDYSMAVVATDPPYYDNVGYADLSDFFYGWLRRSLGGVFPALFGTVQTPKTEELVADPYRHGGRQAAADFFETGFNEVFSRVRRDTPVGFPVTVFYAFKQSEDEGEGAASTGWQTLLAGMLSSGWQVTATWPIRTERSTRMLAMGTNALASSIVLCLRPRPQAAETVSRRAFVQALRAELPRALRDLQQGSIAPVDMAQAAIGPGMAVFSLYARVLEADGSDMTVRTALALINQALDEVLAEQEGDFDAETRFAVKWFSQYGWNEAPSGEADVLTRAVNTTVSVLERGGIFRAAAGKARLLEPGEMSAGWNPAEDRAISVWEVAVRLGHALLTEGLDQAAVWMRESASRVDLDAVKELAYLMYSVCERKGWTEAAMLFNALGTSWADVSGAARAAVSATASQGALDFDGDDE